MRSAMLCLLLLSGCSDVWSSSSSQIYALSWSCSSIEGCERTDQVTLIDRVEISMDFDLAIFTSTATGFRRTAQLVPADDLPDGCSWLHAMVLFTHELEPAQLCRTSEALEVELSIPNSDPTTHSDWFVEGRAIGP